MVAVDLEGHDCELCEAVERYEPGPDGIYGPGAPPSDLGGLHRGPGAGAAFIASSTRTAQEMFKRLFLDDVLVLCASMLVVLGMIFNVFAGVLWFLDADVALAWLFGVIGMVSWMLACTICAVFYPGTVPKHGKRR